MSNKCEKCGKTDSYNFQLNIGLCNLCIMEELNRLQAENERLRKALKGLYEHTKNNYQICGLNQTAKQALKETKQ